MVVAAKPAQTKILLVRVQRSALDTTSAPMVPKSRPNPTSELSLEVFLFGQALQQLGPLMTRFLALLFSRVTPVTGRTRVCLAA